MRWLGCIGLLALSCAAIPLPGEVEARSSALAQTPAPDAERAVADSELPAEVAIIMHRLAATRLAFTDPSTLESYRAIGPYRVVSWGQHDLKLVGYDADGMGVAHIDIRTETGSMWVMAQIRDREFLLRVD